MCKCHCGQCEEFKQKYSWGMIPVCVSCYTPMLQEELDRPLYNNKHICDFCEVHQKR